MPIEIERKFLVNHQQWKQVAKSEGQQYRQGYLMKAPNKTIRVRLTPNNAFLTIKGQTVGFSTPEFEYEIPRTEATQLLDNFSESELSKIRFKIDYKGKTWEIDEFLGDNLGLIVAEIELTSETEPFEIPIWIEEEVTGQEKYYNANLSVKPFKNW